jgi:Zn-dependent peptidase ImmA (M78 family)/DNA-binding XRE family transcriptional regulator
MGWSNITDGAVPVQPVRTGDSSLARLIGARIRKAREDVHLSQGDLAKALGLSQAAVSTIENGTRPLRVDELVVLSRVIGREVDYFLAPSKLKSGPVGVSLRAEVAALPVPEFRAAVGSFLDEIERQPLPVPIVHVHSEQPEEAAREVLAAVGHTATPVDVHAVARDLGVGVFARPLTDVLSAMIIRHGESAVIGVNESHPAVRQRFSIAHELGHFVMDTESEHFVEFDNQSDGDPPHYNWQKERKANMFAAELLMPADRVRADAGGFSISRLARRYGVSEAAMGFRLANLRLPAKAG